MPDTPVSSIAMATLHLHHRSVGLPAACVCDIVMAVRVLRCNLVYRAGSFLQVWVNRWVGDVVVAVVLAVDRSIDLLKVGVTVMFMKT